MLDPVIERYRHDDTSKFFRGDAAFAIPELYELLEFEGYRYTIRLKANPALERYISHLLTLPVGRPPSKPHRFYHSFEYQAQSWDRPLRVVAKVEWHCGELFRHVGFIVTNLGGSAPKVVDFYNRRGTAEQWIREGKHDIGWTWLSCHSFEANQIWLQLHVLAYNLGNFLRRLALPPSVKHWTLTTLRDKLIKIGGKMVRHARYVTDQLAEVAIPPRAAPNVIGCQPFAAPTSDERSEMSMCPHARRTGPMGPPNRHLSPRLGLSIPFPEANPPLGLGFRRGGALFWFPKSSAGYPGGGQMGNPGYVEWNNGLEIAGPCLDSSHLFLFLSGTGAGWEPGSHDRAASEHFRITMA